MKSRRFLNRIVPAFVTRLGMEWPGYAIGGSAPVYGRGDGWYREAGVRPPRNWCGRSSL
jgi:hypothetical protein